MYPRSAICVLFTNRKLQSQSVKDVSNKVGGKGVSEFQQSTDRLLLRRYKKNKPTMCKFFATHLHI